MLNTLFSLGTKQWGLQFEKKCENTLTTTTTIVLLSTNTYYIFNYMPYHAKYPTYITCELSTTITVILQTKKQRS